MAKEVKRTTWTKSGRYTPQYNDGWKTRIHPQQFRKTFEMYRGTSLSGDINFEITECIFLPQRVLLS